MSDSSNGSPSPSRWPTDLRYFSHAVARERLGLVESELEGPEPSGPAPEAAGSEAPADEAADIVFAGPSADTARRLLGPALGARLSADSGRSGELCVGLHNLRGVRHHQCDGP